MSDNFNNNSDKITHATDDVTTALTDKQLDAVAGGWMGIVGAFAGKTSAGPSRQYVEEITGCRIDIGCNNNN
jgi:hypothetical protein